MNNNTSHRTGVLRPVIRHFRCRYLCKQKYITCTWSVIWDLESNLFVGFWFKPTLLVGSRISHNFCILSCPLILTILSQNGHEFARTHFSYGLHLVGLCYSLSTHLSGAAPETLWGECWGVGGGGMRSVHECPLVSIIHFLYENEMDKFHHFKMVFPKLTP